MVESEICFFNTPVASTPLSRRYPLSCRRLRNQLPLSIPPPVSAQLPEAPKSAAVIYSAAGS
ncbi:MAG: hypothetical protein ABS46_06075 [Cytophagaceae bacterium SCN 52-12]|nr:MAG: hypothetical protein ABS46_06075 [Cytophagaceae bacterium SCN 52-12]